MKRNTLKFVILMLFIAVAIASARLLNAAPYLEEAALRGWIDGWGAWGPVVYILVYSIAPVFMLPGLPITVVGGVLFGPVMGSVYVAVGATIGSSLAFLVARKMGRGWVEERLKDNGRLSSLDTEVERQGWKIVAFTRLIPVFPYNMLNYAFGLTKIRFSHYVVATFFFMLPGIVAYVVLSSSLLALLRGNVSREFVAGAILIIIVTLIPVVYRRYMGKKGPFVRN